MTNEDCIFCKIIKGEIPANKVYENKNFIGILDIKPKADGHTLIIPKKHYRTILDMPSSLACEATDAIKEIILNLIKNKKVDGFNIIVNGDKAGGQLVMHAHIHVIPRKEGDGLKNMA